MNSVLVIGSINMDLVVETGQFPAPGETVLGLRFDTYPGGKGANQAVAARRLGAQVAMIGCVGDDAFERVTEFVMKILHEPARLRLEDAGCVHEHDLAFGTMDNAVVGVARGLRLGRDDGDLGADQRVEQRGFADVGATDKYGEAGF